MNSYVKFLKLNHEHYDSRSIIYNKLHPVDVFYIKSGLTESVTINITLITFDNSIAIKLREVNDYFFSFETVIDSTVFAKLKLEQSLEVGFEEMRQQIVELLKETSSKETFIKLEVDNNKCQLIFYGKSKIKSVVYLVIDLTLTDPKEIITEMSDKITLLVEKNEQNSREISNLRQEITVRDSTIKRAFNQKKTLKDEFFKQLDIVYNAVTEEQKTIEKRLISENELIVNRIEKVLEKLGKVNREVVQKNDSFSKLTHCLHNMKLENQQSNTALINLKSEVNALNLEKEKIEKHSSELDFLVCQKNKEIENSHAKNMELEADLKEAAKVISQKTQMNEEIAKDLVQANQMLVNFNFHYDQIAKECDMIKEKFRSKELIVEQQQGQLENLCKEFSSYKRTYSQEIICNLKSQLAKANEKITELENQTKEAVLLNNVLTKKLSSYEFLDNQNPNVRTHF